MPENRSLQRHNQTTFLASQTENGKNILAGRYARVSTDDRQTLAMQTDLCRSKFT
jgi:hypothetical protein